MLWANDIYQRGWPSVEGVTPWTREFVDRQECLDWMKNAIETCANKSIVMHLYGIGGIGKSRLLKHWHDLYDGCILIDCAKLETPYSRLNHFARSVEHLGQNLPRFDFVRGIKLRLLEGIEPAKDEGREWLADLVGLVPFVSGLAETAKRLQIVGRELRARVLKKYGELGDWLHGLLGENWSEELLLLLWKREDEGINLMMAAIQEDLNRRRNTALKPLVVLIDGFELTGRHLDLAINGRRARETELWHRLLSGIDSCLGVTAGRSPLNNDWCRQMGVDQAEIRLFNESACRDFLVSREIASEEIQDRVVVASLGHPLMMESICDAVRSGNLSMEELTSIESEPLDPVRIETWRVVFSRANEHLRIVDRAALVPMFSRDTLRIMYPEVKDAHLESFLQLSFVRPYDKERYSLHMVAKEFALAELKSQAAYLVPEVVGLLVDQFLRTRDFTMLGLAASAEAILDEDSACDWLVELALRMYYLSEAQDLLKMLETVEFRNERQQLTRRALLGIGYLEADRTVEAESALVSALHRQEQLAKHDSRALDADLSLTLHALGRFCHFVDRTDEAENLLKSALGIRRQLSKAMPGIYENHVADTLCALGRLYRYSDEYKQSEESLQEAAKIRKKLQDSSSPLSRFLVADALSDLGLTYYWAGKMTEAETILEEALQIYRELAGDDLDFAGIISSDELSSYVARHFGKEEPDRSETFTTLARDGLERTLEPPSPARHTTRHDRSTAKRIPAVYETGLVDVLTSLACIYIDRKQPHEAERVLLESLVTSRRLARETPEVPESSLSATLNLLGVLYSDTGRLPEAEAAYRDSLEIMRDMARRTPAVHLSCVADVLNNLGLLYVDMSRPDEAEGAFMEALSIRESLVGTGVPTHFYDLANTHSSLGTLYRDTERAEDSENEFNKSIKILRSMSKKELPETRSLLSETLCDMAVLYDKLGRLEEADQTFAESLEISRQLSTMMPEVFNDELAGVLRNIGQHFMQSDRLHEAETTLHESLSIYSALSGKASSMYEGKMVDAAKLLFRLNTERLGKSRTEAMEIIEGTVSQHLGNGTSDFIHGLRKRLESGKLES